MKQFDFYESLFSCVYPIRMCVAPGHLAVFFWRLGSSKEHDRLRGLLFVLLPFGDAKFQISVSLKPYGRNMSEPFEEWLKCPNFAGYILVIFGYIMLDPHFIVSIHGGTSKSSLLIVVSTINHPFRVPIFLLYPHLAFYSCRKPPSTCPGIWPSWL